ncbi:MAG: uroporphyrinogen-III C-methyltransferase [Magnetospirillum sp.]|nr:uroporphyrinogen-III C-methyltransferase [Magnetospirillum sp.]
MVVYDRLVSPAILALVPVGTARIFAGKESGRHHMVQDDINQLLLRLAQGGRRVVRLKGGDPFVFGRGSEEALHLARHGVRFEVVPGITAAAGCSAYAGIPLTHRGLADGVRFLTGHAQDGHEVDYDWAALVDPACTLVIYMGLAALGHIAGRLVAAGLDPAAPAAAIESGTTGRQRRVVASISTLAERVRADGLEAPALIVIGRVVELAAELDWFLPGAGEAAAQPAVVS